MSLYSLVVRLDGTRTLAAPQPNLQNVRSLARLVLTEDPSAAVSIVILHAGKREPIRFVVKRATETIGEKAGLSLAKAQEIVGRIVAKHPDELPAIAPFVDATPANDDLESALRASLR